MGEARAGYYLLAGPQCLPVSHSPPQMSSSSSSSISTPASDIPSLLLYSFRFYADNAEFADPPIPSLKDLNLGDGPIPSTVPGQPQLELPSELPTSLLGFAHLVLATADPDLKCILTKEGVQRMRAGKLKSIRPTKGEIKRIRETVGLLDEPPRFATIVPLNKRGKL